MVLICHSSYRGVVELCRDLFDYSLSLGTVHNFVHRVVPLARRRNDAYDLQRVRLGAHDAIFQATAPVLVGVDVASTYCYLLSQEEHRDADTWGVRLLELQGSRRPTSTVVAARTWWWLSNYVRRGRRKRRPSRWPKRWLC